MHAKAEIGIPFAGKKRGPRRTSERTAEEEGGLMQVYASAEDYLEAILVIGKRRGVVRSIDIANELNFSKPSVSIAMKKLRESGHIEMDRDGFIHLLPSGAEIAEHIYERHRVLTSFFIYLGVREDVASADACKVEHDLSNETFDRIKEHVRRMMGDDPKIAQQEQKK